MPFLENRSWFGERHIPVDDPPEVGYTVSNFNFNNFARVFSNKKKSRPQGRLEKCDTTQELFATAEGQKPSRTQTCQRRVAGAGAVVKVGC